ncbi:uncharacterized protein DNG_00208 [Cephalotrichum gorgonifer]|uniref:Uncharacterized protein n=1 Tax=Cephalotrichum gorgonifer TaxID=2041049 RepID=A0AAE8MPK2_9PEZI|nr:uncharacterized protein DNG_00208 [Cephalotrichum gorgonifer]
MLHIDLGLPPDPISTPQTHTAGHPSLLTRADSPTPSDAADKPTGNHGLSTRDTVTLAVICAVTPTIPFLLLIVWFRRRAKRRRARITSGAHQKWDPTTQGTTTTPATRSWVDVDVEMARGRQMGEQRRTRQFEGDMARGVGSHDMMMKEDAWMGRRDVTSSFAGKPYSEYILPAPPPPVVVGTEARHDPYYTHPTGIGHAAILQQPTCHPLLRGQIPTHH